MKTVAGLLPSIDVRGIGGFVNIVGTRLSYTENGKEYPTANYIINKLPIPLLHIVTLPLFRVKIYYALQKDYVLLIDSLS